MGTNGTGRTDGPPLLVPKSAEWWRSLEIKPFSITYYDGDFPVILGPWIWAKPENSMETKKVVDL